METKLGWKMKSQPSLARSSQQSRQKASHSGRQRPTPRCWPLDVRRARLEPVALARETVQSTPALRYVNSLTAVWVKAEDAAYCLSTDCLSPKRRAAEYEDGGMILANMMASGAVPTAIDGHARSSGRG